LQEKYLFWTVAIEFWIFFETEIFYVEFLNDDKIYGYLGLDLGSFVALGFIRL
jgi:hypothetical protein